MERRITLKGQEIQYEVRVSARSRRIGITVHPGAAVIVSIPPRGSILAAERFLHIQADWVLRQIKKFENITAPKYTPGGTAADYKARKSEARKFVRERLKYFNEFYRVKYGVISIRNQKTRWGSCSIDRNLSFNYKLVTLPIRIADYIIVHELCHTQEFNHSPRFWALVSKAMPDYQKIRKQLRGNGMEIE